MIFGGYKPKLEAVHEFTPRKNLSKYIESCILTAAYQVNIIMENTYFEGKARLQKINLSEKL